MRIDPVFVRIGSFSIYWYGVLIMIGCGLAAVIASRLSRRNGHDPEFAWDMLTYAMIGGILGARLWHVVTDLPYYLSHPDQIIGLQMSGLRIYGGVFGGALALAVFAWRKKLRFWEWADYAAPGLILAQAIGRWGNFINQESYGPPTDLPWGIYIDPSRRLPGLEMYERFHPFFFYESILNFIVFLILLYLSLHWVKKRYYGDIICLYGVLYSIARIAVEPWRLDPWKIGEVYVAQIVALVVALAAALVMWIHRRPHNAPMAYVPGEPWQPPEETVEDEEALAAEEQAPPAAPEPEPDGAAPDATSGD